MRYWIEIALTLVLFAVVMSALGVALDFVVPPFDAWLVDHLGSRGATALIAAVILATGIGAYVLHQKPPKPKREAGED